MHEFQITRAHSHLKWDNALPPALTITSGSTLTFDLPDGGNNQFTASSTSDDVPAFDFSIADPACGPIFVTGAEPGDVLAIEFLDLETADFGWTAIFPDFGLLATDFVGMHELKIWDLKTHRDEGYAVFRPGIHVPLRPFLGVVGVAPAASGQFSTIPPYITGGNIDCKHITTGSTLYLPIAVPGALLSLGDGHAAQGDGEVCGTAIETPMKARVRVTVQKHKPWVRSPHYVTSGHAHALHASKGEYAALGIGPDLAEAARMAVRSVMEWLVAEKSLTRVEAYMLCSVVGDLRLSEVVDMPHFAVACSIPLSIFV